MFWSWIITRHTLNLMSKMRQRRVQPFHTAVRIQRVKSCFQCRVRKDTRMINWSAIHYWTIVQIRSIMGSYWSFIVVQYANTPIQPSRENRSVANKWCHERWIDKDTYSASNVAVGGIWPVHRPVQWWWCGWYLWFVSTVQFHSLSVCLASS